MTTTFKILLGVSVALFLASLTEPGSAIAWGFLKHLGAVLFIVFYIGQLLHKEVVKFEEERRLLLAGGDSEAPSVTDSKPANFGQERSRSSGGLTTAHSH